MCNERLKQKKKNEKEKEKLQKKELKKLIFIDAAAFESEKC